MTSGWWERGYAYVCGSETRLIWFPGSKCRNNISRNTKLYFCVIYFQMSIFFISKQSKSKVTPSTLGLSRIYHFNLLIYMYMYKKTDFNVAFSKATKSIQNIILRLYYTIRFTLTYFGIIWACHFNLLIYFVWLRMPDEGSIPEILIWSILFIIQSYFEMVYPS